MIIFAVGKDNKNSDHTPDFLINIKSTLPKLEVYVQEIFRH